MRYRITEVQLKLIDTLEKSGFYKDEARAISENLIDAEISGKYTHGLSRLNWILQLVGENKIDVFGDEPLIESIGSVISVNGNRRSGYYVMDKCINYSINKLQTELPIVICGLSNTSPSTGMVGYYARKVAENNNIIICFNNTPSIVAPFGSKEPLFGTNPITIGIPSYPNPIILDFATSATSWGEIFSASLNSSKIPYGVAMDDFGNITTNPLKALSGTIMPLSGHKGSGLSFVIEILAGALTGSKVGRNSGGWGTMFVAFKKDIFQSAEIFDSQVNNLISQLKKCETDKKTQEILYPGEKSSKSRDYNLKKGTMELKEEITNLLNL